MTFLQKSSKKILKRDILLFILTSIFLVASETWLFKGGVLAKKVEITIRLIVPIMLVVFFRKYTISNKGKVLLVLYGILCSYMLLTVIFSENPNLVALNTAKYLYILAFPMALLLILRPSNFSYRFLYIPVYLGLFFAIQTIILFILVQTGNPPPSHIVTLVGYKNMPVLSYGLWGYAHGMQAIGHKFLQVYRAQSFFGEPTVLACFLEVSTILSFGLYKMRKDKKMLITFILCATSLVLTFSMTAYVVILLILCFNYIVKYWKKIKFLAPIVSVLLILLSIIIVLSYLQVATSTNFYARSKLGMAFGHSPTEVTARQNFVIDSLRLFKDYPFGIGLIGTEDSTILKNYPKAGGQIAPFVWSGIAGLVGFIIQLTVVFYLMKNIILKHINDSNRIERYLGLSFVALLLHHCLAGDWFTGMFFYLLVCLIVTDAYQFSFYKVGREIPPTM